jgi:hypothetical protein
MTRQHTETMHQPTDKSDIVAAASRPSHSTETRIIAALAEARKVRHHRDCHCLMFEKTYCNAADALWSRCVDRELRIWADTQGVRS